MGFTINPIMDGTRPTLGIRVLLHTENLQATWSGDTLLVASCRTVNISKVFDKHQVGDNCYNLLPLYVYPNTDRLPVELWFKLPGSNELTKSAQLVHCSKVPHDKGKAKHISITPKWSGNQTPFIFNSPSFMHRRSKGLSS